MKLSLFFWALFFVHFLAAQSFMEVPHFNSFEGVSGGCVAIADVNGDAFPDVLVTGRKNANSLSSRLYFNDGTGNFSERVDPPFLSVDFGSMAVADMNGDGHPDVILTGRIEQYGRFPPGAMLWLNDGKGNFSKVNDAPFSPVASSAIDAADVNGDSFIDVLITGQDMSGNYIAKLYINDGAGHFTEVLDTPFVGVERGAVAIADVNGDKHPDILITGKREDLSFTSKLYINDGSGRFSEMADTPFADVFLSAVAIADVNGDHQPDVLISGVGDSYAESMKLYINDGKGNFTEMIDTPFGGLNWSSIAIADVTGDKYPDVLTAGEGRRKEKMKIFKNDGKGNFTEMAESPFVDVSSSTITVGDVNGDHQSDVIITGKKFGHPIMMLYINSGSGQFNASEELPFASVHYSSVAIADLNRDRHPDVLITGRTGESNRRYDRRTILYTNDGTGQFSTLENTNFVAVSNSAVAVADVNGDKNPDVLISGITNSDEPVTKLYVSTGPGHFKEIPGSPFEGLYSGSVAIADVNGDHNSDILISGQYHHQEPPVTKLYLNSGSGNFKEKRNVLFPGVRHSSVAIADVNGDQNPDIFITGEVGLGNAVSKLYLNSGKGKFSEMTNTPFPGVYHSSVAIADVTGDGYPDIFLSGKIRVGDSPVTKLYVNTGRGHFTEMKDTPFEGVFAGSIEVMDMNGDLHPDVFISGEKEWKDFISKLYINDGSGHFEEVVGSPFEGVGWGSVTIEDVTGDHRPDILITGKSSSVEMTRLYIQSKD